MLPEKPVLNDYQTLVARLVIERGFDKETPAEVFMLLLEEVGEFAKAIRKTSGMKTSDDSKTHNQAEEAGDIFWLLIDLCNRLDIDLEKAFREKEIKNRTRTWK